MGIMAQKHQDQFQRIKENIDESMKAFRDNRNRYHHFRNFVFKSTLDAKDRDVLAAQQLPEIEFNVLESYLSRLRGEFSKQSPSLTVRAINDSVSAQQVELIEGITRAILTDSQLKRIANTVYDDILSGGYSVLKVFTAYQNEDSFDQVIRIERVYEPTLCGFDPLARQVHKGDGRYCFELFPKTRREFEQEFPGVSIDKLSYSSDPSGSTMPFRWSYQRHNQEIVYIAEYYEKVTTEKTIVEIINPQTQQPQVIDKAQYEQMVASWNNDAMQIALPPPIRRERKAKITKIMRYRLVGDKLIERPKETSYAQLPLVFVDGNSVVLNNEQVTRPYIYNAKDAQRVKNFVASKLINDVENRRETDVMIAKEALPQEDIYLEAYRDVQKAKAAFVYNSYDDGKPLPPPQYFAKGQIDGALMALFNNVDQTLQSILGSYDAELGIQKKTLSGVAIVEGATQSNNAAMPYVMNYMASWNQVARILVDLIPKYYATFTTVPVIDESGKHHYQKLNGELNQLSPNALDVVVEAGANFEVQKNRALETLIGLMNTSEGFRALMETQGLPILMDNLDIRGREQLKQLSEQFMQTQQQKAANQPNPAAQELQLKAQQLQVEQAYKQSMAAAAHDKNVVELIKAKNEAQAQLQKAQAEDQRTAAELWEKQVNMLQKEIERQEKNNLAKIPT